MFLFIFLNQEYIDLFCTRKGPKNKEGLPRKVFVLLDNAFKGDLADFCSEILLEN